MVQTLRSPRRRWIPQVSPDSSWGSSQLFPTPVYNNATAKILLSAMPLISLLPIFSYFFNYFLKFLAFLFLIKLSLTSVAFSQMVPLNLLDLFHATPQLERHSAFSCIIHSSPLQNISRPGFHKPQWLGILF